MDDVITWDDFAKVDIRVGRVVEVEEFPEARRPAWKLQIDFGPDIGLKRSSAQITNYTMAELMGRLVLAVVNFPPRQIGCLVRSLDSRHLQRKARPPRGPGAGGPARRPPGLRGVSRRHPDRCRFCPRDQSHFCPLRRGRAVGRVHYHSGAPARGRHWSRTRPFPALRAHCLRRGRRRARCLARRGARTIVTVLGTVVGGADTGTVVVMTGPYSQAKSSGKWGRGSNVPAGAVPRFAGQRALRTRPSTSARATSAAEAST